MGKGGAGVCALCASDLIGARQGVCVWMVPGACVCAGVMDGVRARVDAMPCVCVYARLCGVCVIMWQMVVVWCGCGG